MATLVKLTETLDTRAAGRLAADLAGIAGRIALDAGAVTHVGGLAAQILVAAHRSHPDGVTVVTASPGFDDALRRLGLDPASLR